MTPNLIVLYEWSFESVEEQPATIASKMILFRGEKVFRVGLKNYAEDPILFFMAIDLNKIGMEVEDAMYGIQGSGIGPAIMKQMGKDYMQGNNLQLFTTTLDEKVVGNCTVVFRICIEGTVSSYFGYSFQLSDRLAKDQLWATVKNQQNMPDVEFIVKDNKKFTAHKAILAARSPVFADKFEKKQQVKGGPHQIRIDDVEPSTVENFLHFIYTGESMGTLADEELLKLAKRYKLTTLTGLCQHALEKIDAIQMAKVRKHLNNNPEELSSSKIT
jgi:speckle-type POZ protein